MVDDPEVRVGRFVVRSRLGRGAMGTVFRALDPHLQRDVALKVLDRDVDAAHAEAVAQEARSLARLAHPNVVSVYELGREGDQVFVAMEYVPGCTVREHTERHAGMAWQELVEVFLQAGRGLLAAHEVGLVHRDIKPENLLVRDDGRVLVADFGLARMVDAQAEAEVAGTPHYLAPEVLERGEAGVLSDQFAFCASLWRLLDPEAPLRSEEARIPVSVREALLRGTAVRPEDRWPSMRELIAALEESVRARPDAHHRALLLQRVERLWIDGVLRASLGATSPVPLVLTDAVARVGASRTSHEALLPPTDGGGRSLAAWLEVGHGSLLLLGEAGSGKTLCLLQLAEVLLGEARRDPAAPAPVVLHLASLATARGSVGDWAEEEMVAKYGLPRRSVRTWIEEGALTLLLDGLDEIAPDRRARCVAQLDAFHAERGLGMVVTCRTGDYDAIGRRLGFGHAVKIEPLAPALVHDRLGAVTGDEGEAPPTLDPALRTPLLLRLLETGAGALPSGDPLPWLHGRFVQHAFDRRGVAPERQRALREGLGFLARAMTRSDRSELWLEQLEAHWVLDGGLRPAAQALGVLLLAAVCLLVNVPIGHLVDGDAVSGLIFGLCSVPMVLAFNRGLRIQPVERLRFSWRRLVRLAPLSLGLGIAGGAVYGLFYVVWVNVVFGAAAGLVTLVTVAFEPAFQEGSIRPNQGIRQSLVNGLAIGLLGLVLGAVTLGYVAVPLMLPHLDARSTLVGLPHPERSAAAVAGPLLGVIAGMVHGGLAVLMHVAVRLVLALSGRLPLRLVPFLDEAVDLALLRRIGGGYIFPHRTLQAYFAAEAERSGTSVGR